MNDFFALLGNPHVWVQFPHVLTSGVTTAGFFVLGISAYNLIRRVQDEELFRRSFRWASAYATVGIILVTLIGHSQAQHMIEAQPMKMAAAEALWESEDPASLSLLTIGDLSETREIFSIRIPRALSLLAYNRFDGRVRGINEIQVEYEQTYGPGDYVPPMAISYWTFRAMVGAGALMLIIALYSLYMVMRGRMNLDSRLFRWLPFALFLPYLANSTGWLFTEIARQPWIVFGLQRTEDAISPTVSAGMLWASLIAFTLLYGILMAVDVYLLAKFARPGEPVQVDA
jgi:cytochrome d ubiquinol oxidase subunit I